MLSVYKIKFTKSSFDLNEDYDRFSDIDKEKIADMESDSFFDYEEDNIYTFLAIAKPEEVKRYLSVLSENLVKYEITDISENILKLSQYLARTLCCSLRTYLGTYLGMSSDGLLTRCARAL